MLKEACFVMNIATLDIWWLVIVVVLCDESLTIVILGG